MRAVMSAVPASAIRDFCAHYVALPTTVHVLCLGSFLNRAGSFVVVFLSIYAAEQLNLGPRFGTWCVGAVGLGSVISSLVGGQLADQLGRRTVMLVALVGGAVILLAMSELRSAPVFLTSVFLFALVMEMYRPACGAMIGDVASVAQRPYAFGLMYIAINLGFAVSSPLGGLLASRDFRWLFWGDAITTVGFAGVVYLLLPETLPRRRRHAEPASAIPAPVMGMEDYSVEAEAESGGRLLSPSDEASDEVPLGEAVRRILSDGTFLLYCLCNLLTCMVFMQAFSTLPLHLRSLGYSSAQYGLLMAINGVLIVVLQLPVTHALKRFNPVAMILAGDCLLAVGFGLTALATRPWMLVGTIVLWTCGEIVQAPFKQALVTDLAPVALRARYLGVFTVSFSLAMLIGAPLGGEVLVRFGAAWLWPGCFLVTALAIGVYLLIFERLTDARRQRAAAG